MAELVEELHKTIPDVDRIYELMTDENIQYIDFYGKTVLMNAFKYYGETDNCDSEVLLKLLDMDCKPQLKDNDGCTALMYAFLYYGENKNCDTEVLLKLLNMDCRPFEQDNEDCTSLMYALSDYGSNEKCDSKVLLKLLDMDCKPQLKGNDGCTALMYAFGYYGENKNCDSKVLLKLLNMDCRPYEQDNEGYTPLMYAFLNYGSNKKCDSKVLLKLLNMDCKPELQDIYGYTALMYAFKFYGCNENYDPSILSKLLDMNCQPQLQNAFDETALMYAFRYYGGNKKCDYNIIFKLFELDCKPKLKNDKKQTLFALMFIGFKSDFNLNKDMKKALSPIINNNLSKDIYNCNELLHATKFSNKKLLDYAINTLHFGYKEKFIIVEKKFTIESYKYKYNHENGLYPIDYLVKRIYDYNKINYDKFYYGCNIKINREDIELDTYYLLSLLKKIDYNYKNYCTKDSEFFIEQLLLTKTKKENVLGELLCVPPINGFFNGGTKYYELMKDFESFK
jgi:ankyrin repeat protein